MVLVLSTASLMLSGCFSLSSEATVEADGSGELVYTIAIDTAAIASLAEPAPAGTDIPAGQQICNLFWDEVTSDTLSSAVTTERLERGSTCGAVVTIEFDEQDNPGVVIEEALTVNGVSNGQWVLSPNDLGGWQFKVLGLDQAVADNMTSLIERSGLGVGSAQLMLLASSAEIDFELTLPGYELSGSSNAGTVESVGDATQFSWRLALPTLGRSLEAQTAAEPGMTATGDDLVDETTGGVYDAAPGDAGQSGSTAATSGDAGGQPASGTELDGGSNGPTGTDGGSFTSNNTDTAPTVRTVPERTPPASLAFSEDRDLGGLLLGLGTLMAFLALGGFLLIKQSGADPKAR